MSPLHLDAGKYAAYLWPAWGLSALALAVMAAQTLLAARRWRKKAESGPAHPPLKD